MNEALEGRVDASVSDTRWTPNTGDIQRSRANLLRAWAKPSNLSVIAFARRSGQSTVRIYRDIKRKRLLTLRVGGRRMRVPDFQLRPAGQRLAAVLMTEVPDVDLWTLYDLLTQHSDAFGGRSAAQVVKHNNIDQLASTILAQLGIHREEQASFIEGNAIFALPTYVTKEKIAMDKLDEHGLPILSRSPRDESGGHWGLKYGIGWSNHANCPERVLLTRALRRGDRKAIEEAIAHYGYERVAAFWARMRILAPPFEDMRPRPDANIFRFTRDELHPETIVTVDQLMLELGLCRYLHRPIP